MLTLLLRYFVNTALFNVVSSCGIVLDESLGRYKSLQILGRDSITSGTGMIRNTDHEELLNILAADKPQM